MKAAGLTVVLALTTVWLLADQAVSLMCPALTASTGAIMRFTGTSPGDSATFSCLPGFLPKAGDTNLVCLANGNWSGIPLTCVQGKPFMCCIDYRIMPRRYRGCPCVVSLTLIASEGNSSAVRLTHQYRRRVPCFWETTAYIGVLQKVRVDFAADCRGQSLLITRLFMMYGRKMYNFPRLPTTLPGNGSVDLTASLEAPK